MHELPYYKGTVFDVLVVFKKKIPYFIPGPGLGTIISDPSQIPDPPPRVKKSLSNIGTLVTYLKFLRNLFPIRNPQLM